MRRSAAASSLDSGLSSDESARVRTRDLNDADDRSHQGTTIHDLRVLYDVHGADVFRLCRALLGDRSLAEEAVQETFLRAWRSAGRWDPELGGMSPWIHSIARNVCLDALRMRRRRPVVVGSPDDDRTAHTDTIDAGSDAGYERVMSRWMIDSALARLDHEHREAVVLAVIQDRPHKEIAASLGIAEGTLRTRVFYGLKALRKALEEVGWHD